MCTSESRVKFFFSHLRDIGLWPEPQKFEDLSVSTIVLVLKRGVVDHCCEASDGCPLKVEMRNLYNDCDKLMKDALMPMEALAELLY
jgi:hypothetical protein